MTAELMIEHVKRKLNAPTDAHLAKVLGISPQVLSKLRAGTVGMGPAYLVRIHEATGMRILDLKTLLNNRRPQKGVK